MESRGASSSELSSMAATVEDLVRRVAGMAEASAGTDSDRIPRGPGGSLSLSQELFEIERSLAGAARRLSTVAEALGTRPGRD